jgi:hypothetical protein
MTLLMTFNITALYHYAECHNLFIVLLNVISLNVSMLSVMVLSVIMLTDIVLSIMVPFESDLINYCLGKILSLQGCQ